MAKKHMEKQPPPSTSLKANQKQKKQPPPSSVAASFPTNSLANPEITGKQKEKQVPPRRPPDSPSVSSSDGEEYPPSHLLENPAGTSTAGVMPKHLESSSNSTDDVADEAESSESDYESKEEELQVEKKQPPLFPPSSNAKKKQVKQQPQSSIRPRVLDKSEKTGSNQKNKKQQQPPLLDSPFASSSNGEESPPPPSYRLEKRASASTSAVLPKLNLDSLLEEEDESSETDHESNEEEPSDDFPVVDAKPSPQLLPQENKEKQTSSSTSRSGSGSEDEEGEEEEGEEDSSSESDQRPPVPSNKQPKNMAMKNEVPVAEKVSDSSSESDEENSPPRISSKSTAAPPRSNPVDCPAKPMNNDNIIVTALSSSCSNSKRKRASEIREETGQEKKFPFKRIWSTEDELSLLRGVLDYKKRHNIVPSNLGQLESLYNSLKGSISSPATLSQMIEKLRRIRLNYIKRDKKLKESMPIRSLNDHSAAIFNISTSIWGEEKRTLKNVNGKEKLAGYPSLHRFIKYEHTNCPSVLRLSHISNAKSNKLEEKCENLEITEVRLHVKKQELFSVALELIDCALTKCG